MYETTEIFISKYSYFSSSLWSLHTQPLKGSLIEPYDEVPYGTLLRFQICTKG